MEHALHVIHTARVPIFEPCREPGERPRVFEHVLHACDRRKIPRGQVPVESEGVLEHGLHACDGVRVPRVDVGVEIDNVGRPVNVICVLTRTAAARIIADREEGGHLGNHPPVIKARPSTATVTAGVTDEIDTVTALDDASKDVFKISQQLANQVATSVKDPSKTIAFTETEKVDASVNNKAPTAMTLSANSITDGAGNLQIGTLSITDPDDPKPVPIWKIAKLADHGDFEISADGNLTLKSSPDLAAKASYSVTIVATDTGGATITKTFTITVKAAEGAVVTLSNNKVAENHAGAEFGTLSGAASYKLAAANDDRNVNKYVEIVEIDGVFTLKLKDENKADYETNQSGGRVDIIATAADGKESEHSFSIFPTDVDEAPEAIALDGSTLREGEAGQVIGKFSATDPEGERLTFKLAAEAGNNDNDLYEIVDGSTLKLKDGERL